MKARGKFKSKNQADRLKCGHVFHLACIDSWFMKSHSTSEGDSDAPPCPMCRAPIKFSNKNGVVNWRKYRVKIWKEWKKDFSFFEDYSDEEDGSDGEESDEEWTSDPELLEDAAEAPTFTQQIAQRAEEFSRRSNRVHALGVAFAASLHENRLEMALNEIEEGSDSESSADESDGMSEAGRWSDYSESYEPTTRGQAVPFSRMRRDQHSYIQLDRSYNRHLRFNSKLHRDLRYMTPLCMREVIRPPRKELRLQAKKGSKNKNYPKKPMCKDRRRGMSRQGQDFGCSRR